MVIRKRRKKVKIPKVKIVKAEIPEEKVENSTKTTDKGQAHNDDLGFEINFDGYQKKKNKNAKIPKIEITKVKIKKTKSSKLLKKIGFRVDQRKCDVKGVSKLYNTRGALITVVEKTGEKSESSKQFWELIKDHGLNRPGMHNGYS